MLFSRSKSTNMAPTCSNLRYRNVILLAIFTVNLLRCYSAFGATVSYDANAIIINGQRRVIISGSIHYPRSTPEMWPDLIQKAKDGGLDAIDSYVFWNLHEPRKRQYDFTGRADIIKFFQLVQKAGLYGILRIGPYVCAKWNYGGFPMWLHSMPGIQMRTNNQVFKSEMQVFVSKIVGMFKEARMFAPQGGPIILAQIENAYGDVMESYGADGKAYLAWCAEFAQLLNVGVPWIMCKQPGAPAPMIETCNGFYCDTFKPTNPKSPKIWTENWTGWYERWGESRVFRAAEDIAYAVALFYQAGGVLQNYYLYHGGTNFERTAGGPFITTSYHYDAPLNEYGGLNQPKWGHLKNLHAAIKMGESFLTTGTSTTTKIAYGAILTTFTNKAGERFCFLNNPNPVRDVSVDLGGQDGEHNVPPWSVTLLNGCSTEIYNTAKVTAPTYIWDYYPIVADPRDLAPDMLSWSWVAEPMTDLLAGKGFTFNSTRLLDQKDAAADQSDYLWYMTSPVIRDPNWSKVTLSVNSTGHVLRAFVNGNDLGPSWSDVSSGNYNFVLQSPVSLNMGNNVLVLLSATVGLQDYGAFFDTNPDGISGGPVRLLNGNAAADLSTGPWFYKVGLDGERFEFYNPKTANKVGWRSDAVATERALTWYKANFDTPKGPDPVVVDMSGMNKGHMWVNGFSLGRYWVTMNATTSGCHTTCDYRGQYTIDKCMNFCGQPTQKRYHIPKSYLNPNGLNTLVVFEEFKGNPATITFAHAAISVLCGTADEGQKLELWCGAGHSIHEVRFVGFGDPQGSCLEFEHGTCEGPDSTEKVKQACWMKPGCTLNATKAIYGPDRCTYGFTPKLSVEVTCWPDNI